jgi:hypothetical protein
VLVSRCATYQEAQKSLETEYGECTAHDMKERICNCISTWGGGLVEVKARKGSKGVDLIQLMQQTVFEFVASLEFKSIVLLDRASIFNENGHSIHLKYLLIWKNLITIMETNGHPMGPMPYLRRIEVSDEDPPALSELISSMAYHVESSELTTGISQLEFLSSIPSDELYQLSRNRLSSRIYFPGLWSLQLSMD